MIGIARQSDTATGVCHSHTSDVSVTGSIVGGYSKVLVEGLPIARIGDLVTFTCGHMGIIDSGTSSVLCNGIAVAMLGSVVVGYAGSSLEATITSASNKVQGI